MLLIACIWQGQVPKKCAILMSAINPKLLISRNMYFAPTLWYTVVLISSMYETKWPATYTRYFALGVQLSPALQSPFSFHLGCGYARNKYVWDMEAYSSQVYTVHCNSECIVHTANGFFCFLFFDVKFPHTCMHLSLFSLQTSHLKFKFVFWVLHKQAKWISIHIAS